MPSRIAVLVPCYNAAATISELASRIAVHVPLGSVFMVDDGSSDGTREAIRASGARLLVHEVNRGKGVALKTGFEAVQREEFTGVITLDADLQHLPEHLPAFLGAAPAYDIVVGTRAYHLANMPFLRWATNHLTSLVVSWIGGVRIHDSQSGYRYLSLRAIRDIPLSTVKYDMESEQLIRAGKMGMTIGEVPIETVYEGSKSYINPFKDTGRFIRMAWRNLFWRPPSLPPGPGA
jgi:glycosyltransferase involved in cell wall biosynthesis